MDIKIKAFMLCQSLVWWTATESEGLAVSMQRSTQAGFLAMSECIHRRQNPADGSNGIKNIRPIASQ